MGLKLKACSVICSLLLVLLTVSLQPSSAGTCNFDSLTPCLPAYQGGKPTSSCCAALKSQSSCFCAFAKIPLYKSYIYSSSGRRVVAACGLKQWPTPAPMYLCPAWFGRDTCHHCGHELEPINCNSKPLAEFTLCSHFFPCIICLFLKMGLKLRASSVIRFLVLVLLIGSVQPSSTKNCSLSALSSCLSAYEGEKPTSSCCKELKSQMSCFCTYAKNSTYKSYLYSSSGRRIASSCGLKYPHC
ncbi:putative non-specific lipid-transfer protein 2 [Nymphaea thermarum]|nr:putative non-specific lipid-transfer protein 2 [Nymphaea thermarum]